MYGMMLIDMHGVTYANNLLKNPAMKRLSGKNGLSPFHLVVFSQTLCWLCPHCACAQKNWAVPFHYLVFCMNSFPVLTGIFHPFTPPFPSHLLLCIALSFQLGDVSTKSSIPFGKFWQLSMGVKPTCHFV